MDKTSFRYLVEAGSRNRRTLAMDWRGHGESAPEQGDFGESALIEDVLSVIEESGVQKVVPVALAHAGWVAIELRRRLAELFKQKPRAYWMEQLEANDVPYTPVYNLAEVFQDPQIQHMGLEIQTDRKTSRSSKPSSSLVEYSDDKSQHPTPPPELGEHNSEFLKSPGYDEKAMAELKEKGVI